MQTAFTECTCGMGGHLHPELIYAEVLDEHDQPVRPDEAGEIVITTLGVEGMPLVRYRTGDKARLHVEPCTCGRTTPRIGPIIGRGQHMIKLKGTTLYPPAIFECVHQVPEIKDFVVEVSSDALNVDVLKVRIVCDQHMEQQILKSLRAVFQSGIKVTPEIILSSQADVEKLQAHGSGRKLRKFIDNRSSAEF
jgi:phenylacetate-CoA ligase